MILQLTSAGICYLFYPNTADEISKQSQGEEEQ